MIVSIAISNTVLKAKLLNEEKFPMKALDIFRQNLFHGLLEIRDFGVRKYVKAKIGQCILIKCILTMLRVADRLSRSEQRADA